MPPIQQRRGISFFCLSILTAISHPVTAQETIRGNETASSTVAKATPKTRTNALDTEELIITARKRNERVQDIPVAITAISGSDLDAQHIDDALDIQYKSPNLFFSKTNFTGFNLQIRGIGSAVTGASAEYAVGLHVNTVPLIVSRLFEQEFFDMERVEILRGPQGTLFGRNSTGGSLNLFTHKPQREYDARGELQVGNFTAVRAKAMVNIPISDSVRTRISGMYHRRDGFIENQGTGNDIDDRNLFAVRGSLQVDFTDDLQLDVMAGYFREDDRRSRIGKQLCTTDTSPPPFSTGCTDQGRPGFGVPAGYATLPGTLESLALANIDPALALYPVGVDPFAESINPNDLRAQNTAFDPSYFTQELMATMDLHQRFDDFMLSWVSGFQATEVDSRQDFNMAIPSRRWEPSAIIALAALGIPSNSPQNPLMATALDLGPFGLVDQTFARDRSVETSEQYSTELRAVTDLDGPINFTLGVSYLHFVSRNNYQVSSAGAEVLGRLNQLQNPAYNPALFSSNNETNPARFNSLGVFGEGYWAITEDLQLTLGARVTWDKKTIDSRGYLLNPDGILPGFLTQEAEWFEPTGRASLEYNINLGDSNRILVYASAARGYKPGGFNPPAASELPGVPAEFDPESLWAYELGTKSELLSRRMIFNLTGFFYDYRDYQISKIIQRTAANENINAFVWGVEAELSIRPFKGLTIESSAAYLGTRIRNASSIDPANRTAGDPAWTNVLNPATASGEITSNPADPLNPEFWNPDAGIEQNLDGNELPSAPDFQVNVQAAYTIAAPVDGDITARASYYWQSAMFSRIFNTESDRIDAWSQADASVRWTNSAYTLWVDFWIKNILDNDEITGLFQIGNSGGNFRNAFLLDPRTFGVTIGGNLP